MTTEESPWWDLRKVGFPERQDDDPNVVPCPHPAEAIMWNKWNQVVQCHRCGAVTDHPRPGVAHFGFEDYPRAIATHEGSTVANVMLRELREAMGPPADSGNAPHSPRVVGAGARRDPYTVGPVRFRITPAMLLRRMLALVEIGRRDWRAHSLEWWEGYRQALRDILWTDGGG